jgi:hypothetical protein
VFLKALHHAYTALAWMTFEKVWGRADRTSRTRRLLEKKEGIPTFRGLMNKYKHLLFAVAQQGSMTWHRPRGTFF